MRFLLSIKTVFPKPGAKVWYDDQRRVHRQLFESDETVEYAFMGQDPEAADNRWLREAFEQRVPIIYFLGIAPGRYQAIVPSFIAGWDAGTLQARVAFGVPEQGELTLPESPLERRYALRAVKQRLHQASFREAVITAYGGRCALSGLPEPLLLDAAHIIADKDEALGQPVVPNGIPLSKIHHAAFDAHLIGTDPDHLAAFLKRLLRFARCHAAFSIGGSAPAALREPFARLRRLVDVPAILVMVLYDCHDQHQSLSQAEFASALALIESYVFRRAICGEQTRGYWSVFANLAYRIDPARPFESLRVGLARLRDNTRFPDDDDFRRALEERDM